MKTRLLDDFEFKATFESPMQDITSTASEVIDIWQYVDAVPVSDLFGQTIVGGQVEHVYRNAIATFDHVLVSTRSANVYLVIVVDLKHETVFGHHMLDLNSEYGLTTKQ